MKSFANYFLPFVFFALLTAGCTTTAMFDQYAYVEATSIKVDALSLIDRSSGNYADFAKEVEELNVRIEKTYEYEKHRPNNEISTQLWTLLKSPDKNLLGGLLKKWRADSKLNEIFAKESKTQISDAFDIIIELESKKIKPTDDVVLNFINKQK